MVPYEEFVEDISEGDQIHLRSSEGEFTGEVLKIRKTSVKILSDEEEIVIPFELITVYKKVVAKKSERSKVQVETEEEYKPIRTMESPIRSIDPPKKKSVIVHTEIHGYRILPIDHFQDEVMRAVKEGRYKNKRQIDSFLQSFENAKKIHEDQIGQHKMDDILAKIRREILKNPTDNFLVLLLGAMLHHCGHDDLAEEEFQRIYRLTSERKSKTGDPSYITQDMEFVGSVYKFNIGSFSSVDFKHLKPGESTKVSSYGFLSGHAADDPKKIIGNLYFNLNQVSDPEFRRLLMARNFRHKRVRFKVGTSIKGIDPYPAADDIRLVRLEGWIQSFGFRENEHYENAGKIADAQGQLQTFNLTNVADPILRAYLENRGEITTDDDEIQVSYILRETIADRLQAEGIIATREFSTEEIRELKSAGYITDFDVENWRKWRRNNLSAMNVDENYKPLPPFSGKLPEDVIREHTFRDPWANYEPSVVDHDEDPYRPERYQDWIRNDELENAPKFDEDELYDRIYFSLYGEMQNVGLIVPPAVDKSKISRLIDRICSRLQEIAEDPDEKLQLLQFDFANANESFDSFSKRILQFRRSGFDGNIFVVLNSFTGEKIDSNGIKFILEKSVESDICFFIIFTRKPIDSRFQSNFDLIEI